MSELVALLDDQVIGRLRRDRRGRLSFVYAEAWRSAAGAYPLSLSLPLFAHEHQGAVVEAFVWGLLPDNELILERWAKRFQVSARNAFALLSHVGEECAGAVRFTTEARVDALMRGTGSVDWLDEHDIAERLRSRVINAA